MTGGKLAQLKRSKSRSREGENLVTQPFEHAAYLAVATLVDRDIHNRMVSPYCDGADLRAGRAVVGQRDALTQAPDVARIEAAGDRGAIRFLDAESRMKEAMRKVAVVGQEQRAGGVIVQPPDRNDACSVRYQIGDGTAPLWIAQRRHHPERLV